MNQYLRSLTPTQQVGALFIIVFGLLVLVSVGGVPADASASARNGARRGLARAS